MKTYSIYIRQFIATSLALNPSQIMCGLLRTRLSLLKFVLIFFCILFPLNLFSQNHLIEVKRLPNWGKDYLTIVDAKRYYDPIERKVKTYGYDYYGIVDFGLLVYKVNDKSAKGMTENEFYNIIDNKDEIRLVLSTNSNHTFYNTVIKKAPYPELFLRYNITPEEISSRTNYSYDKDVNYIENKIKNRDTDFKKYNLYCTEVIDPDFDWYFVSSYDFLITGNDPLIDKKILQRAVDYSFLSGLKRDTEHPDILLTISKNADESIQSTYIPPTSRTVNKGSTTRKRYNWITEKEEYVTEQDNYTIHEGGYTQTTNNTNIFLELAMLDAKKINDKNQVAPPIVWQITFRRHAINPQFNIVDEYLTYSTWSILCDMWYDKKEKVVECWLPNYKFSNSIVTEVLFDDPNNSLKVGDKIVKFKWGKKGKWIPFTDKIAHDFSNPYWWSYFNSRLYSCKIIRNGKTEVIKNVVVRSNSDSNCIKFYKWD